MGGDEGVPGLQWAKEGGILPFIHLSTHSPFRAFIHPPTSFSIRLSFRPPSHHTAPTIHQVWSGLWEHRNKALTELMVS